VVLKRLADAVADHDHIYAVIKGVGVNNDGSARVSFAAPSVDGQAEAIAMAQALAGVDAGSITYVETHGTGTALGDPVEIAGLTQAFRLGTERNQFCAIGSVKSNIGHLDAAAGIAGLIKTALALQNAKIPASLNYTQPNPKINFAETPFYVNAKLADWPAGETPRRAGVSAFGSGGTNAHVILEEAPERQASGPARSRAVVRYFRAKPDGPGSRRDQRGLISGFQRCCSEPGRCGVYLANWTAAFSVSPVYSGLHGCRSCGSADLWRFQTCVVTKV
jgi:Polyketide synthase modules and related proteins